MLPRSLSTYFGLSLVATLLTFVSTLACAQVDEPVAAEAAPIPGAPIVQTFFVPFPETDFQTSLKAIDISTTSPVGNSMRTIISIVIPSSGSVVTYDHWEDGYESDPGAPAQSSTLVWGDGISGNGIAPGYPTDLFPAGAVITLSNLISLPRNSSTIAYDGQDRISATKAIAVTRAGWAVSPGTVLASATEVYDTRKWGTAFVMPVGVSSSATQLFEYSSLHIMAKQNGTVVNVDLDNNGTVDATQTLNIGQNMIVNGGVQPGTTVTASQPVEVHELTGDIGSTFESRTFAIRPTAQWSSEYYAPAGTTLATEVSNVFLFNPGTSAITVTAATTAGTTSFSIAARSNHTFNLPMNSGARFTSAGAAPFYAIGTNDSGGASGVNQTHDWGYALLPSTALSTEIVVAFGVGSDDVSAPVGPDQNGSPVWVTPSAATTLYVNYSGDYTTGALTAPDTRKYDIAYPAALLESVRIYDTTDKDMTKARIFTADGTTFAAAWGEDSAMAGPGSPYLDMGTTIIPFPLPIFKKTASLAIDLNGDGLLGIGDVVEFTLSLTNDGVTDLPDAVITDTIPAGTSYVTASTKLDDSPYLDDATGTPFPLDGTGVSITGGVLLGGVVQIKFSATLSRGSTSVSNTATVSSSGIEPPIASTVTFTVTPGLGLSGTVFNDTNALTDNLVNGTGTNTGGSLFANLVDGTNTLIATSTVAANGTYAFTDLLENTSYTIVLSTSASLTPSLPANWANTGEHLGSGTGSDGSINGILPITTTSSNISAANFGIRQTGTLNGHLYIDTNGNGTQDGAEPNLPNVDVLITDANGTPQTVTTNASGNWTATVPPGSTTANIDETDPQFPAGSTRTQGTDPTTTTTVAGVSTNCDTAGYYIPATLTGHLYIDSNGNGTQDGTEPNLPNVDVLITDANGTPQTVTTNASGNWTASVPPGSTTANVDETDPQFPAGSTRTQGTDPTTTTAVAGISTDGGTDGYYIPATLTGHLYIDTNGNGTQDGAEPNLPNVDVLITDANGTPQTVTTNASGNWTASVPPGSTIANVDETDPQFPAGSTRTQGTDPTTTTAVAGVSTDGGTDGYYIPATLTGHLYIDSNGNGTQDGTEPNLPNVDVLITDSNGTPQTVTTNASGNWTATVPPGSTIANVDETDPNFSSILTPGYTQTQGTDPTTTTAVAGVSTDGGIDGYNPAATYTIAGQVRFDSDKDGSFQDPDQPLPGFTVKLYSDANGNSTVEPGIDILLATQTSGPDGGYTFTGFPNGDYLIIQTPPNGGSVKTNDKDLNNDRLIPIRVSGASSTGNDFLEAADPQGWFYDTETGQVIPGGQITVPTVPPGGAVNIVLDGSTGEYAWLTNGVAGTYTMAVSVPPGYTLDPSRPASASALDPTALSNPYQIGSGLNPAGTHLLDYTALANPWYLSFTLESGDPSVIYNNIPLLRLKPISYPGWQARNTLSGQNGPTQNPDGDGYTNLEEFSFCYDPASGVNPVCPLNVIVNSNGTIDATVRRITGAIGLTYELESISDLSLSTANGGGWTPITSITPSVVTNPDGTEIATYTNLAQIPALAAGKGFVRAKVTETSTGTIARTKVSGWSTRTLGIGCQSIGDPFLPCPVFSGLVDNCAGATLDLTTSAGSQSIVAQFTPGVSYYVEVTAGDNAGQRWEINEAASTATSIGLDLASSLNTQATAPISLIGDSIAVRRHLTVNEIFPPAKFTATNSSGTADRILISAPGTAVFTIYWLYANSGSPKWIDASNVTLADMGSRVIDNSQGLFIHPRATTVSLILSGKVRQNPFATKIPIGNTFITGGWPLDQSPATRLMSQANGFTASRNPLTADKIQFWVGDTTPATQAYTSHYLLNYAAHQHWTDQANATLANENALPLFKSLHAHFIRSILGKTDWVVPLPWVP